MFQEKQVWRCTHDYLFLSYLALSMLDEGYSRNLSMFLLPQNDIYIFQQADVV